MRGTVERAGHSWRGSQGGASNQTVIQTLLLCVLLAGQCKMTQLAWLVPRTRQRVTLFFHFYEHCLCGGCRYFIHTASNVEGWSPLSESLTRERKMQHFYTALRLHTLSISVSSLTLTPDLFLFSPNLLSPLSKCTGQSPDPLIHPVP